MKKIFLTSGLVLCMACPAFADFASTATGTVANACDYDHLGVYDGPTTMQAKWNALSYSITYAANTPDAATGYTNTVSDMPDPLSSNVQYDSEYTVEDEPTLTGYTFDGWKPSLNLDTGGAAASDLLYQEGDVINEYKAAEAVTMTAQWTAKQTTVSYNCGTATPGSTAISNGTATFDDTFEFAAAPTSEQCTPATGSSFAGWSCGGATYAAEEEIAWRNDAANITCTAVWSANTIAPITWDIDISGSNWSADANATTSCTYGTSVTLPNNVPSRTGYEFGGWEALGPTNNNQN